MTPLDRIEQLTDRGSFEPIRSQVAPGHPGVGRPGDGVLGGTATVDGRHVVCFAQDGAVAGGSLGRQHAETLVTLLGLARRIRVPVIGAYESAGARLQEGATALDGYARVFRAQTALRGVVPQIAVMTGCSAGGGCYSPALADLTVMVRGATMFLTGPAVVRSAIGETTTAEALGGVRMHGRNGVADLVVEDLLHARARVGQALSYLAPGRDRRTSPRHPEQQLETMRASARSPTPRGQDVKDLIGTLIDGGSLCEIAPDWARNAVTVLARIEGQAVGLVANQPAWSGGVLDAAASQKIARHVRLCDRYRLPLVVLVDTPGFMPGERQEAAAIITHGAAVLEAFASATVPSVTVVVGQAYGGAFIAMNSKGLGADLTFAWPQAVIGVLGAQQAVEIIHRAQLRGADDAQELRQQLTARYANERQTAAAAVRDGVIDEVLEPSETRRRLSRALALFGGGNLPTDEVGAGDVPADVPRLVEFARPAVTAAGIRYGA